MTLRSHSFSMRYGSMRLLALCLAVVAAAGVFGLVDAAADATSAEAVKTADIKSGDIKTGDIKSSDAKSDDAKSAAAEKTPGERKSGKPSRELPTFTPEREAAALTFVTAHHAELTPLLSGLKLSRPNEYQRAIRKLFADSERLAHVRELQPKQYELKLQEWKLESRIQLLVARLTMERTPALEAQLRAALEEQLTVHRNLLMQERERTQQRIAALDREISQIDDGREQVLKDRFNRALSSVGQKKQGLKSGDAKSGETKNTDTKKATP